MSPRLLYLCKSILLCILIIFCALGILLFPDGTVDGALSGIVYCLYTLIPSLFPFMVLSAFVINSGISHLLGKLLQPVTKCLFYLPGSAGSVIVMSMVGGYPIGARGCMALFKQGLITQSQAHRMLYFCVNAGPAFIISVVGSILLQNTLLGILLFFAQIAAMLGIGIVLGLIARLRKEDCTTTSVQPLPCNSPLVESTLDASRGILNMCAFVVLFSSLLSLLDTIGITKWVSQMFLHLNIPDPIATSLLPIMTEITRGCVDATTLYVPAALLAFGLGFGGFCVHFQIFSMTLKSGMSKLKFLAFRLLHGIIAALITIAFTPLLPHSDLAVFNHTTEKVSGVFSYSFSAGIALILCCVIFLFSIGSERRKSSVKG